MYNEKKKVFILLTSHSDLFSKVFRFITNSHYTHASIGFDDNLESFYSFRKKTGFCLEKPTNISSDKKGNATCQLYSVTVSKEDHLKMREHVETISQNPNKNFYNTLGLIMTLIRLPYIFKKGYFCSQFVAETLNISKTITLNKESNRYFPQDFCVEPVLNLCFSGTLGKLAEQV